MAEKRIRLTGVQRKNVVLAGALKVSKRDGLLNWTRKDVADACAVPTSEITVKRCFPSVEALRTAVANHQDATDTIRETAAIVGIVVTDPISGST